MSNKVGDLKVWWIPQLGCKATFEVPVASVEEGVKLMDVLADYDKFQLDHRIKPDYCNTGGIQVYSDNGDGEGAPGWEDWYDDETGEDNPRRYIANN